MRILNYILWTREIIFLMNKKKEITFLGKESSMKQVSMTRNIYSCMNRGVCLPTESSIKICLWFLDEVSLRTYGGKKTSIPNRFCKLFDLHDDKNTCVFDEAIQQHSFWFWLSHQTVMNNQSYTIQSGITQPHQFSLGNIPTMSCITDSIGEGWDDRKIAFFVNKRNNIVNGQEEVPMTRSKHFEHACIIMSTITKSN